jgi:hypothetical protein
VAPERSPEIFTTAIERYLQLMDERLRYEQLIGGKLQSLPVPDMQDAIWSRIKTQLDLDMPTDDGDGGSSPQSPSGPKIIGWSLSVVIIAFITVFFLLKNKPSAKTSNDNSTTTEQSISPDVQNNGPPLPNNNTANKITTPASPGVNDLTPTVTNDSAFQQDLSNVIPGLNDTVQTVSPPPSITFSPQTLPDTNVQVKKGRGMKGLNDSSYRIVPKNKN